jgi:cholesterol transport system auxiliary component
MAHPMSQSKQTCIARHGEPIGRRRISGQRCGALTLACATLAGVLLASCGAPQANVTRFDLGPPMVVAGQDTQPMLGRAAVLADFSAPTWLDDSDIVYRLAYEDPAQVHSYTLSRWVAAPASLLSQRLRERLPLVFARGNALDEQKTPAPRIVLRVELEEFCQVFDTTQGTHVLLQARATLIDARGREAIAQRQFAVQRPAATPDALGAAHALREAADQFLTDLLAWLEQAQGNADPSKPAALR